MCFRGGFVVHYRTLLDLNSFHDSPVDPMRLASCFIFSVLLATTSGLRALEPSGQPIVRLDFEERLDLGRKGKVDLDRPGPQPPAYPDFNESNAALALKAPAYLRLTDQDEKRLRFDQGDTITAEAWVNLDTLTDNAYIIGKGRTDKSKSNQNWAFRLRKQNAMACVNFLFRSRGDETSAEDWHRWTSTKGFAPGSGWHHVAVSYQFGQPESIRGFIDGKKVNGRWDMGGATQRPPVVDNGEVWIGSSMGGARSNSLDGRIDNLVVHRRAVPDAELAGRFHFIPQPIKRPAVPEDGVLAQLFGPFAGFSSFPDHSGSPVLEWEQDTVAINELPHRYDAWGVRDDWIEGGRKAMMLRLWTDVILEPGDYQLLIRSRGFSRLSIDKEEVVSTPAQRNRSGAHHVVDPLPEVAVPGMRPHFMNDHERIVEFHSDGGKHEVLLELMIGGPSYRLEVGETCVALARPGEMFYVLSPTRSYPLTDDGWNALADRQREWARRFDRKRRRQAATQQDDYWQLRHRHAKKHLVADGQTPPIDQVIDRRITQHNLKAQQDSQANTADAEFYRQRVQPILNTHCVRCHGDKQKGALTVLDRDRLLAGGESGEPAVVSGKPDASYLMELISAGPDDYRMPPKGDGLSEEEVDAVRRWISAGAPMPKTGQALVQRPETLDDHAFLRRVFIDTVGVPPTPAEARLFLDDRSPDARQKLIERLLSDDRWADNWVGYWQDVLAENPNLLKPTLNNTGPFRYWIHEALTDNKSLDRFATELILMRGSTWYGGAAGFSVASQNDVPMAAKAHVIGTAFLGIDMKCARCHDAPYHSWKQSDLFQLAAMLERKPITLPDSSTVPAAFFEAQQRKPLIDVTLKPGSTVPAQWPFAALSIELSDDLLQQSEDSRELLAAQVTGSRRFAEVLANRFWARLMGAGIVEPVDDWEGNPPSDPELLATLTDILIAADFDQKELARAIFTSDAYQRAAVQEVDKERFFAGPYRRRMTAEQIVDSALHVAGISMETEQLTLDVEGTLPANRFLNFGFPERAWEFSTLANERDRPSLALPKAQAITDVLKAFGWRNSRPEPTSEREETPNLIQPGVLANGTLGVWLTRLSDDSAITRLARDAESPEEFVDNLFLRILTRRPTDGERQQFVDLLTPGFEQRLTSPSAATKATDSATRHRYVSWSNHLNTEANVIKIQMQDEVRQGPPPTKSLSADWRSRAEDALWALMNSPEMILVP